MLVFVVDDDADILETVDLVLRLEGCRVLRAGAGHEAQRLLDQVARGERERPGLVLIDLMLPDMRGEDVYDRVRAVGLVTGEALPAAVMSAAVDSAARAEAMGLPLLAKPFDIADLLAMVDRHRHRQAA